jgi:hypothetical protein
MLLTRFIFVNFIRFTSWTIFPIACTSKSIADLIEKTQIYREIHQFQRYYDTSYRFPARLVSDARLIKLQPTVLKLAPCSSRIPDHATIKAIAPNLRTLSLTNLGGIGPDNIHNGMSSIIATMTNLTELRVVDFLNVPDYFTTLPPLPKLKNLKLQIDWCFVDPVHDGDYDWNILKSMTNLESLNARPHQDELDFSRFTFLTSLRDLYCEIDDLRIDENIKCLTSFQSLKNIYINLPVRDDQLYLLESIPEELNVDYKIRGRK